MSTLAATVRGQVRVRTALAGAVVSGGGRLYGPRVRTRTRTLDDVFADLVTADGGAGPA